VAVKKKAATKKVAKKRVVKKAPAKKKTAAKKITKKVAKKAPARKKAAAKRVVKKAPARKKAAAKKAPAKKKTAAKKVAKKAPARKKTAAKKIVIPPVPLGDAKSASRVNVSTTPAPAKSAPAKPSAAPKQGTSPRVLIAAIIGIALLAIVVISRPASDSDTAAPVATESAAPEMTEEATPEMTEEATPEATEPVDAVEAPGRFIGNWKDAEKSVMVITWKAPAATAGLTGYKFEVRSGMGEWTESGMLPATQLSVEFTKGSADGSTSFRVSSVYSDGQMATAKAFGFAGQFA
jgi:hypothetical protein